MKLSTKVKMLAAVMLGSCSLLANAEDFPGGKGIELVAGYGPGGGHDIMLRAMAKVLTEEKLVDVPVTVVNKDGGGSAVSMGYLNGRKGDGHYLMAITSSHIVTPLKTKLPLNYASFTPIARLGIDPELLVVNPNSKYPTMEDIVKAEGTLNVGGTSIGSIEQIAAIQFSKLSGVSINFIPFDGDAEVVTALLSNQIDFAMTNPGSVTDFLKTNKLKALAISTTERIDNMPDVPTFQEQGYDITLSLFRGVTAPADISPEAKAYLIDLMTKLNDNEEWKAKYLTPNSVVPGLLTGDDFAKYLADTEEVYKQTLIELGLLK